MADEMIKFRTCLASELDSKPIINGSIILCYDSGDLYSDTIEGDRIKIADKVRILETENDRTSMLIPESDCLYIVVESKKLYIYTTTWVCLNENGDFSIYMYIPNVEIAASDTTTITDNRITVNSNAIFHVDASLYDLAENSNITCTCKEGQIEVISDCNYVLYGTIEVNSTNSNIVNAENIEY